MHEGDFSDYEVLLAQSTTNGGFTISLWMTLNVFRKAPLTFEIDEHNTANAGSNHGYRRLSSHPRLVAAWPVYLGECAKYSVNP
jgi:hypothetical protein